MKTVLTAEVQNATHAGNKIGGTCIVTNYGASPHPVAPFELALEPEMFRAVCQMMLETPCPTLRITVELSSEATSQASPNLPA